MKKIFLVAAIAFSFIACNNSAESTTDPKDSIDSALNQQKQVIDSIAEERKELIDTIRDRKLDSLDRVDTSTRR